MSIEKPNRRFEVTVRVSGDEWSDIALALNYLLQHIEDHGPKCDSVGGGPSSGHYVQVVEDPAMTHEKYFAALDAYLEAKREVAQEIADQIENPEDE